MRTIGRLALGAILSALAAAGARAECKLTSFADLPVTVSNMQPVITAKINGADARFIIDSGAFYSTMSQAEVAQFGLTTGKSAIEELVGVGGTTEASLTKVAEFTIAGAKVKNVWFLVARDQTGDRYAGFLGQNLLGIGDVDYDLANGQIRLMKSSDCGHAVLAYWVKAGQPYGQLELSESASGQKYTSGAVVVNGKTVKAMFDTGSGGSFLTLTGARRLGIGAESMVPSGAIGGIGHRQARAWTAPVASIEIGGEKILHTKLTVIDYARLEDLDMIVGMDFFLSHRIYVANSQHKLYFTYGGGPVFNLETGSKSSDTAPVADLTSNDASAHGRRGAAMASRREFGPAVAELTRAIELAPKDASYVYQRGVARMALGQSALALADLDTAVSLAPDFADARMARARMRVGQPDKALAIKDIDVADKILAKQADERLQLAELYEASDALPAAIGQYGLWIEAHRTDSRLPGILNARCWTRTLAGVDLAAAVADCDMALRRMPKTAAFLDSRGLAHLRIGDPDKAIADYDQALAVRPKSPTSLYGRGLARLKKGQIAEGKADIAAAVALDPNVAAQAKKYGFAP